MATAVTVNASPESSYSTSSPEGRKSQHSLASGLSLPNVFVTPPQEEQVDRQPWCCFDAEKDAQPGALANEDLAHAALDYSEHADGTGEAGDSIFTKVPERENVFVMHSLMEEAESLKERLRGLDLSSRQAASASRVANVSSSQPESHQAVEFPSSTSKSSFFSLRKKGRKSALVPSTGSGSDNDQTETGRPSTDNFEIVPYPESPTSPTDSVMQVDFQRKTSFFSRKFKFTIKRSAMDSLDTNTRLGARRRALDNKRSFEGLGNARVSQDNKILRRFSFFELPRRFSVSSQSTIPSTAPSMNRSNTSLATSSAPPATPVGARSDCASPPVTPMEKPVSILSMHGVPSNISTIDISVQNLAASLTIPTAVSTTAQESAFSLDPLHFESLEFNSDDFL